MIYAIDIRESFVPAQHFNDLGDLVNLGLNFITLGAGLIFLVMLFRGAFILLTQGASADGVKKAYETITFAVIGLFVVIFSFLAVKLLGKLLGVDNILP